MAVCAGSHFNTELAKCRLKENLTLKAVSELTGISKVTLQNWECGKTRHVMNTSADKLNLLAELYGVSYSAIENMIEDAYKTAKKSEYVYNAIEKTTKNSKKTKKTENPEITIDNISNIQSDESQSESEVITINVKNKSLTKSKNKTNNNINDSETIKLELLELAYGEVTFNEFIAMVKALL